jgi:hypothetical protein
MWGSWKAYEEDMGELEWFLGFTDMVIKPVK